MYGVFCLSISIKLRQAPTGYNQSTELTVTHKLRLSVTATCRLPQITVNQEFRGMGYYDIHTHPGT